MEANELIRLYDQADIADWFGNEPVLKRSSGGMQKTNNKHTVIFTTLVTGLLIGGTIGFITYLLKKKK
ncbi:MAG TPA: hypothetical protein VMT35_18055 [Ignavibacteriaceae bacterium]|nr:hypothetical protein [Ignavibacteriaceae bacterium]